MCCKVKKLKDEETLSALQSSSGSDEENLKKEVGGRKSELKALTRALDDETSDDANNKNKIKK